VSQVSVVLGRAQACGATGCVVRCQSGCHGRYRQACCPPARVHRRI
jgi:hypothetical protein